MIDLEKKLYEAYRLIQNMLLVVPQSGFKIEVENWLSNELQLNECYFHGAWNTIDRIPKDQQLCIINTDTDADLKFCTYSAYYDKNEDRFYTSDGWYDRKTDVKFWIDLPHKWSGKNDRAIPLR